MQSLLLFLQEIFEAMYVETAPGPWSKFRVRKLQYEYTACFPEHASFLLWNPFAEWLGLHIAARRKMCTIACLDIFFLKEGLYLPWQKRGSAAAGLGDQCDGTVRAPCPNSMDTCTLAHAQAPGNLTAILQTQGVAFWVFFLWNWKLQLLS